MVSSPIYVFQEFPKAPTWDLFFLIFQYQRFLGYSVLVHADDLKVYSRINTASDWDLLLTNLGTKCWSYFSAIKDLKVVFDRKYTFTRHIGVITSDVHRLSALIIKSCKAFVNLNAIYSLYYALVVSKIDFMSAERFPIYGVYKALWKLGEVYPQSSADIFGYSKLLSRFNFNFLERRVHLAYWTHFRALSIEEWYTKLLLWCQHWKIICYGMLSWSILSSNLSIFLSISTSELYFLLTTATTYLLSLRPVWSYLFSILKYIIIINETLK